MKWCPGCHVEMPDVYSFCYKCGTPLNAMNIQREKQCPKCKSILPYDAEYCSECGIRVGSEINVRTRKMSFDESLQLIQRLRQMAQDLRHMHSVKHWIEATEAQKPSFGNGLGCIFFLFAVLGLAASGLIIEYGEQSYKEYAWAIGFVICLLGCVFVGAIYNSSCHAKIQSIDKVVVPVKKQFMAEFERVEKTLTDIPVQFRAPEYIDYLADVIDKNRADTLDEAIRLLQYELDKMAEARRIEYERQVTMINEKYRQRQEELLKEAEWLYYIEPTGKH